MQKKKIEETIYSEDWSLTGGPPDVEIFKRALEHPLFKRISLDVNRYYDDIDNVFVEVLIEREETDEEFTLRIERYKKSKAAAKKASEARAKKRKEKELRELKKQEEKELEQLAYLKKKYES